MKANINEFILLSITLLILSLACASCTNTPGDGDSSSARQLPESFSFFDVGINTPLTPGLRNDLKGVLGPDATQTRTVIDLDINYPGFLRDFFPDLDQLNQRLNFPPMDRVEHNTFKLMYRYAVNNDLAFDYVEFLFSGHSQFPLLIKAYAKKEIPGIRETLETKYGKPEAIQWKQESGSSLCWKRNNDLLIVSRVPDPFGNPTYNQIDILFPERIRQLLAAEKQEAQRKNPPETQKKKQAF